MTDESTDLEGADVTGPGGADGRGAELEADAADASVRRDRDDPALSVEGLSKTVESGDEAVTSVEEVSFAVDAGEVIGLLGPNGAGKTTLIKSILGLVLPDEGDVRIHGIDVSDRPRAAYDRVDAMLEYKGEERGITVETVDERNTSKTCACCGHKDGNQRVERGLYICEECGTVANADVNGAENIRRKLEDANVPPSPTDDSSVDRSTGWMAQPAVHLFDRESGRFTPREQADDCKP